MKNKLLLFYSLFFTGVSQTAIAQLSYAFESTKDTAFWQEYHEAYRIGKKPGDNEIRSITVDHESNVWAATAEGIYMKKPGTLAWINMITGDDNGPAYVVTTDNEKAVWLGTWNGVYFY